MSLSLELFDMKGKGGAKVVLSEKLSNSTVSQALLHQVVVAEEANARQGTQCAKTRSEVRGGGRKPYKQKKTGNARQGSINSPHYRHGGMALAVKPRDYSKKVNKKERRAALLGALNSKMTAGDVSLVENLSFSEVKTKEAVSFLNNLKLNKVKRVLVVVSEYDETVYKCFRNLQHVEVRTAPAPADSEAKTNPFSTRDLLVAHKIVIAKDALRLIEEVWGS